MAFKCKQCSASFSNLPERRKHVRKVHSNRLQRTCCGETFKTVREKGKHERSVHVADKNNKVSVTIKRTPAVNTSSSNVGQHDVVPNQPIPVFNNNQSCEALANAPDGKELFLYFSSCHPFSNFYCTPFYIDGVCYRSVEHYYQSEKARYFKDYAQLWNILNSWSPLSAKKLGGNVQYYDADQWREVSYRTMASGVREKFRQNPNIENKLRSSGDRLIAEASGHDSFWANGKDQSDPDVTEYTKWPGKNAMGHILMELRTEITTD